MMLRAGLLLLALVAQDEAREIKGGDLPTTELEKPEFHGGFHAFDVDEKGKTIVGGIGVADEEGGQIVLWNPRTGKQTKELGKHKTTPTWVAFGAKDKEIISFSSEDHELMVWKLSGKKPKARMTLGGPAGEDRPPQLSPDKKFVAHVVQLDQQTEDTRSRITGDFEVWNLKKKKLRWKLEDSFITAFAISPDSAYIVAYVEEAHWDESGPQDMKFRFIVLDAANGREFMTFPSEDIKIRHMFYAPEDVLVAVSQDLVLRFKNARPAGPPIPIGREGGTARRVNLTRDGEHLMVWRSMADALDIYSLKEAKHSAHIDFEAVEGLHEPWFSPSGKAIAGQLGGEPVFLDLSDAIKE